MGDNELDVRQLRKPDKHPTIFANYAAISKLTSTPLPQPRQPLVLEPSKT